MLKWIREFNMEITGLLVLAFFLLFITSGGEVLSGWERFDLLSSSVPVEMQSVATLFLSIFIEGVPFILVGVLISSLIHVYVREEVLWRFVPKNPLLAIPLATFMGLLLPVCECGVVPLARRLIQKGLPAYVAFTFMLAAPVINPITIASTYFAFGDDWGMVLSRLLLAAGIAAAMGGFFFFFFNRNVVKSTVGHDPGSEHDHDHGPGCDHHGCSSRGDRLGHALYHSIFEFMDMGKYFIAGALVAASFQTFVGMSAIREFGENEWMAVLVMMGLAFGLSLCSSADAFVAASFRTVLSAPSLLAFLVYGPVMDLKNLFMMFGSFRLPVILFFFVGTTLLNLLFIAIFFMW